ncbi:flagellar export chaperone FliS [Inhella gelatinilytica]|uniref:Flagellar secretion chaperone FliS n=1 Tax=Inhella gelatinilytica TaxID=2795030 RepID=A0A931ND61_9BURK|nr:flagellar export chaperone FliS [Inhella gelatinilytica]MBH9552752.1 flagellar export chaperone FliS [Inhella gelatinilytica]
MYGTASPFASRHQRPNNVYSRVGLETEVHSASPHRLIAMLFEGLFTALAQAQGALEAQQRELKAHALSRAVRILDEGLKAGLDLEAGGELARQLHELYSYASLRLVQANARDDGAALQEVRLLLEPVRDAWSAIAPQVETRRVAA